MTTAGEAVIGGGIVIGGEAMVGGATAGTGVIVVPGGPGGVTEDDLDELRDEVGAALSSLGGQVSSVIGGLAALASRPRDYPHSQPQPAARWQVLHHLGFRPHFTAYDTEGREIRHGQVTHPIPGEVMEVEFGHPVAGSGYAS